jgi:hypothetical protein
MTSLDPSHLPSGHGDKPSRGQALYSRRGASGSRALPIPDLRFEQSYLRSLRRFIHDAPDHPGADSERPEGNTKNGEKTLETAAMDSRAEAAAPGMYGVPVRIDWGWVLWVTSRDQVSFANAVCMSYPLRLLTGPFAFGTRSYLVRPICARTAAAMLNSLNRAVASLFLRPLLGKLGAQVRIHFGQIWRSIFPPFEPHIQGGAGWMRKQLREFTVGGVGTNIALAK